MLRTPRQRPPRGATTLAAGVLLLLSPAPAPAFELPELAARTTPSVVLLTLSKGGAKAGTGTGFFVTAQGWLVTNHHVIEGATDATAKLSDGTERKVLGLVADDPEKDIAVLQVQGDGYPPLPLGDGGALRPGDEVAVIGSPLGFSSTLSSGIVSAIRPKGADAELSEHHDPRADSWGVQITAAISPGSSGSPVMNRQGEVVAVAVGMIRGSQALNFGVPVDALKALLGSREAGAPVRPLGAVDRATLGRNLGISAGVFLTLGLLVWLSGRRAPRRRPAAPSPN